MESYYCGFQLPQLKSKWILEQFMKDCSYLSVLVGCFNKSEMKEQLPTKELLTQDSPLDKAIKKIVEKTDKVGKT